jgi:1,4-dihydroxy-2-naphthoyl-CoA hydrolase
MSIWFKDYKLEDLLQFNDINMMKHLDVKITAVGKDSIEGTMPVDDRTKQPFGILHGGANCVLAESLGSIAANLVVDPSKQHAVGLSITTNHIKAVRNGLVKGVAKPVHIGRTTHVWNIKTYDEANKLTSDTSLSIAIIDKLGE